MRAIVFLRASRGEGPLLVDKPKSGAAVELVQCAVNISSSQTNKIDAVMRLVERASCFTLWRGDIWDMADALERAMRPSRRSDV